MQKESTKLALGAVMLAARGMQFAEEAEARATEPCQGCGDGRVIDLQSRLPHSGRQRRTPHKPTGAMKIQRQRRRGNRGR